MDIEKLSGTSTAVSIGGVHGHNSVSRYTFPKWGLARDCHILSDLGFPR